MISSFRLLVAGVGLLVLLAGCGGVEDVVDGPFVHSWQLDERTCAEPVAEAGCYQLSLGVSSHDGSNAASCDIYPLGVDGAEYALSEAIASDLDALSVRHEVVIIDEFSIQAGDEPVFEVILPIVTDEGFWRWQVTCDPGAPG